MGAVMMEPREIGRSNGFKFCLTETGLVGKRGMMIIMNRHRKQTALLFAIYTAMLSASVHAQDVPRVPSGTFEEENRDRVGPVSDPMPTFRIERPSPGAQAATIALYIFLTLICVFDA